MVDLATLNPLQEEDGHARTSHLDQKSPRAVYRQRRPGTRRAGEGHSGKGARPAPTGYSARLLGRSDIGELAIGKQADLALFKLDELRFSGSHDPVAALLLCGADRADRVMIGGQWKVRDGQIEGLDLPRLMADHQQAARTLVQG